MRYKKILGSIAALALAVTAFANFAVTANAAEGDIYSNDCSTTTDWVAQQEVGVSDGSVYVTAAKQAGARGSKFTFPATAQNYETTGKIKVKFDFKCENNASQIVLLDSTNSVNGQKNTAVKKDTTGYIWGMSSSGTAYTSLDDAGVTGTLAKGTWYTFDAVLNYKMKIAAINIYKQGGSSTDAIISVPGVEFSGNKIGGIFILNGRNLGKTFVDNISVSNVESAANEVTYVVNYTYTDSEGSASVIKSQTIESILGAEIAQPSMAAFWDNGKKYFCEKSNWTEGMTVAEDTVINIDLRLANTYTVTVTSKCADTKLGEKTYENQIEGETLTIPYNKYIAVGNTLYYKAPELDGGKQYGRAVKIEEGKTDVIIEYTVSGDENVTFYVEAEEIEGTGKVLVDTGAANTRGSNSKAAYFTADTEFTELPAGKYKIIAGILGDSDGTEFVIKAGDNTVINCKGKGYAFDEKKEFTLTETTKLTVVGGDKSSTKLRAVDYILIRKMPDLEVVSAVPEGVTAVAEPAEDQTLTPVDTSLKETTYSELKGEKTLTTFYIKVDSVADGECPIVILSNGDKLEGTQATAVGYCFIYQYLGDSGVTAASASYNGKTWTAPVTAE